MISIRVKFDRDYDEHPYAISGDGIKCEVTQQWLDAYNRFSKIYERYQGEIGDMVVAAREAAKTKARSEQQYQP